MIYKGNGWVHFPSPLNSFLIKGTFVHSLFHWNGTETSKIFDAWLFTAQRLSTENRYLLAIFPCTSGKWKHMSDKGFHFHGVTQTSPKEENIWFPIMELHLSFFNWATFRALLCGGFSNRNSICCELLTEISGAIALAFGIGIPYFNGDIPKNSCEMSRLPCKEFSELVSEILLCT